MAVIACGEYFEAGITSCIEQTRWSQGCI